MIASRVTRHMSARFFDTNVILYLLDEGPKAERATALLRDGGVISVQVLNEALLNCRRKAGMTWDEARSFLGHVRYFCEICDLTPRTHELGCAIGERYQLSVYDAMIVAAALETGCQTLYTEDMHHGLIVEDRLQVLNPFG